MAKKHWKEVFRCPIEGEEFLNDFCPSPGKMLIESLVRYLYKRNLKGHLENGKLIIEKIPSTTKKVKE
ncbi:MAG: hypothetical protein ABFD79_04730 [Phycisphaerales bacterium]